jgi:hypothetical protein
MNKRKRKRRKHLTTNPHEFDTVAPRRTVLLKIATHRKEPEERPEPQRVADRFPWKAGSLLYPQETILFGLFRFQSPLPLVPQQNINENGA